MDARVLTDLQHAGRGRPEHAGGRGETSEDAAVRPDCRSSRDSGRCGDDGCSIAAANRVAERAEEEVQLRPRAEVGLAADTKSTSHLELPGLLQRTQVLSALLLYYIV